MDPPGLVSSMIAELRPPCGTHPMLTGPCWEESQVRLSGPVLGSEPPALEQKVPEDWNPMEKLLSLSYKIVVFFFRLVVLELCTSVVFQVWVVGVFH
jgi:hypothetical protein